MTNNTTKNTKEEDKDFYQKQKLAFYEAALNVNLGLRLNITNLLITISAGMIAALPYFYKDTQCKTFQIIALSLFVIEIILGFIMNEFDSKQINELIKQNEGEPYIDYSWFTAYLSKAMYIIIIVGLILTILMGINL